jgi:hypothetical protein
MLATWYKQRMYAGSSPVVLRWLNADHHVASEVTPHAQTARQERPCLPIAESAAA